MCSGINLRSIVGSTLACMMLALLPASGVRADNGKQNQGDSESQIQRGFEISPPGSALQVMPWPVFGKKTDRDLRAIYEYLRAIPSLPDNPTPGP